MKRRLVLLMGLPVLLSACATGEIRGPAKTIGADVSSLSANLSRLQDDLGAYQAAVQSRSAGHLERADAAEAAARQRQTEWKLLDAPSTGDALAALLTQAHAETDRLAVAKAPAAAAPKVSLPVQPLAKVARGVDGLAQPKRREDELKFLIRYAGDVNEQLATLDDKAGAKPAAP